MPSPPLSGLRLERGAGGAAEAGPLPSEALQTNRFRADDLLRLPHCSHQPV